jgi:uncharacterized membrane protein
VDRLNKYLPFAICFIFFLAYALLSVVRHLHFGSFGFDLGLNDQIIWEYSKFRPPITTIDHVPFISNLLVHLDLIFIFISPIFWIFDNTISLLILQAFVASFSAIPIFLLTKKHNLNKFVSYAILISYLMFYGVQNALWFDFHSSVFGTSFLAWYIYYLDTKHFYLSFAAFILAIISKENYAAMTFLISLSYFIYRKEKRQFLFIGLSLLYLFLIFGIYFTHFVPGGYRFQSKEGLTAGISLLDLINSSDKLKVIGYTFGWTGFLSFLNPIFLVPIIGNLGLYFMLGRDVSTAQGLFLQYRIELAPLLFLATIYGIKQIKKLNSTWIGIYLLILSMILQYVLHLPLSYLTKPYFWHEPESVRNINSIISFIPDNASVVSQNNIIPHISHRSDIFTLWPTTKSFVGNSPCEKPTCEWFRWSGNPSYLIVDTSNDWDIRHLLANRAEYISGLNNLEKNKVISKYKQKGNAILYKVKEQQ